MNKINVDKILFKMLKEDYKNFKKDEQYQLQFQAGFDYMEAMIKLFGVVSVSVLKIVDIEKYKKVFDKNFKTSPTLGDYKSLGTKTFFGDEVKNTSKAYSILYDFLHNKKRNIKNDALKKIEILNVKNHKIYISFIDQIAVNFRNKFKGHGALFKNDDVDNARDITSALDEILFVLKEVLFFIVDNFEFYSNNDMTLYIKYDDEKYDLLPIILYLDCNSYSCSGKDNTQKLFFFNDGSLNKSFYLDYKYNHFFTFKENINLFDEMKSVEQKHTTSNENRRSKLLQNFTGREEQLESLTNLVKKEQATFSFVTGNPGIGKSSLITKLTEDISNNDELKDKVKTYIHYIEQGQTGEDELLEFYSKLKDELGIYMESNDDTAKIKLEKLFEKNTTKLLLIVDGLDELKNPTEFIDSFPITKLDVKINLIFTSRPYKSITQHIATIASNLSGIKYSELLLGKLSYEDTYILADKVLPKKDLTQIDREEIIDILIQKSERLPIYIDFITRELKEFQTKNDIKKELLEKASNLPQKIDKFFIRKFNSENFPIDILRLLAFSRTAMDIDELHDVLKNSSTYLKNKNRNKFKNEFNKVEIFLKADSNNKYSFYHLSVKEAVINHFDRLERFDKDNLDGLLYEKDIEDNENILNDFHYLDKKSEAYELLKNTINYLKKDTSKYKRNNFLHLYNSLIYFNLLHKAITYDDMKDANYESIKEHEPKKNEDIKEFFELVKEKKVANQIEKYEIRYAYELALFIEDYEEVLNFYDMYNQFILDIFLEICTNINDNGNIQRFIELKDEWKNSLNETHKEFFVEILDKHEKINDAFYDVLVFLSERAQTKLCLKLGMKQRKDYIDKHFLTYDVFTFDNIIKYSSLHLEYLLNAHPAYRNNAKKILQIRQGNYEINKNDLESIIFYFIYYNNMWDLQGFKILKTFMNSNSSLEYIAFFIKKIKNTLLHNKLIDHYNKSYMVKLLIIYKDNGLFEAIEFVYNMPTTINKDLMLLRLFKNINNINERIYTLKKICSNRIKFLAYNKLIIEGTNASIKSFFSDIDAIAKQANSNKALEIACYKLIKDTKKAILIIESLPYEALVEKIDLTLYLIQNTAVDENVVLDYATTIYIKYHNHLKLIGTKSMLHLFKILKTKKRISENQQPVKYKYIRDNTSIKNCLNEEYPKNLFYLKFFISKITINKSLEYIATISPCSILKYYNIIEKENPLSETINKLKELENIKNGREKRDKFNDIADNIINDNLLDDFINQYGKMLNISNEEAFYNNFTIDKINLLFKKNNLKQ